MIARCPLRAVLSSHLPSIISIMDACCWLVVVFVMTKWRPSKAKVSHLFNLFLPFESLPELMQRWYPALSTPAAPPLQHPTCHGCRLSVDFWLLLLIGGHLRPTPLPWLYFWCVEFVDPNEGTSSGESDPDNGRKLRTNRERRLNDLGVWRTLRQRYRTKPLGGRTAAAHLGVVMCYLLAPNFVLYFAPLTVVQIFTPLSLPNKKRS